MADQRVQHVSKASSDKLLNKFADMGSDSGFLSAGKIIQRKPCSRKRGRELRMEMKNGGVVELSSLLIPGSKRKTNLFSHLRLVRSDHDWFLVAAFEKTWRRTMEGASKMFVHKYCRQQHHVRLMNEVEIV
ncbi:hypothetical protein AMTRI_Chr09g13800 [Amborella trichopoda]|uniref:Uncharacterized protein n=1 Tax=Amborella trichopoda TaxID=13333 RepID=U5CUW9_AMBTC|nr:uncharacterized protein LOC18445434 [Amborella trichopoda]ERN17101.1 hypothetical protein AMTR_s00044p00101060 [Amborella trichopoda]|eukprot:XP_006855634.1 uncharacterized protein LOC18445434 [Amborella trichopoda]